MSNHKLPGNCGELRTLVLKILAEHGYPPDLAESATTLVLQQAEVLSEHWLTTGQP